jgi:hypothetical protein
MVTVLVPEFGLATRPNTSACGAVMAIGFRICTEAVPFTEALDCALAEVDQGGEPGADDEEFAEHVHSPCVKFDVVDPEV